MVKPRSKNGTGLKFPFSFEKNGRTGRIKKWGEGKFGTYFMHAGKKCRNSFASFEAAYKFMDREFSKLDADSGNSLTLHPVRHDLRTYHELEQILREQGGGATLREAVDFFLVYREGKRFSPNSVAECIASFLGEERARNNSSSQIRTLKQHTGHFKKSFGSRKIHEISAKEISDWLANRISEDGEPWSAKTRRNVRGSLVTLSLYAKDGLHAIPDTGKTEFQKVKNPKRDAKAEVEIYTPAQLRKLIFAAAEHDHDLIAPLAVACFLGLRPNEIHAEEADREPLKWEAFNYEDDLLHVLGQKVRSKATRDVPLNDAVRAWLEPFKTLPGSMWRFIKAFDDKMRSLCAKAEVPRLFDGFRHSYASYRIRQLKGDLAALAAEMGNSPQEIVSSYKRNVTDKQAAEWFGILPPTDYLEKVKTVLSLRQPT